MERSFASNFHPEAKYYNNAWRKGKFFCPEKFCENDPIITDACLLNKALYLTIWGIINNVNHEISVGLFPNGLDVNSLFREEAKRSTKNGPPAVKLRSLLHYMNLASDGAKKMGAKWSKLFYIFQIFKEKSF